MTVEASKQQDDRHEDYSIWLLGVLSLSPSPHYRLLMSAGCRWEKNKETTIWSGLLMNYDLLLYSMHKRGGEVISAKGERLWISVLWAKGGRRRGTCTLWCLSSTCSNMSFGVCLSSNPDLTGGVAGSSHSLGASACSVCLLHWSLFLNNSSGRHSRKQHSFSKMLSLLNMRVQLINY